MQDVSIFNIHLFSAALHPIGLVSTWQAKNKNKKHTQSAAITGQTENMLTGLLNVNMILSFLMSEIDYGA